MSLDQKKEQAALRIEMAHLAHEQELTRVRQARKDLVADLLS